MMNRFGGSVPGTLTDGQWSQIRVGAWESPFGMQQHILHACQ